MNNNNLKVINHPLVQHKLGYLRNKNTSSKVFRELIDEMTQLILFEATSDIKQEKVEVEAWSGPITVNKIDPNNFSIVPIMRAGIGMLSAVLNCIPNATVHFLGIFREEKTSNPIVYYDKVKDNLSHTAIILDPMLATGGTVAITIEKLISKGVKEFRVLTIIASKAGVERVLAQKADVRIYCAAFDPKLDQNNFIIPGLGDAGDRIYNT